MSNWNTIKEAFEKRAEHTHRWRTVKLLKREGKGLEYSVHFLKKCSVCNEEATQVFFPAAYVEMFKGQPISDRK